MNNKDMQYVMMIANYGNITRAAEALYISQPALSIHLNRLEESLGLKLFERTGKKMILTYAGEEFVKAAREITMMSFELEDRMNDIRRNVNSRLRIGYMIKHLEVLFPDVLVEFSKMYPQTHVFVTDDHLSVLEEQLAGGELDLLFGNRTIENSRFFYVPVYNDRLLAVLSCDHPACRRAVRKEGTPYPWLDLKDVKDECFILQHSNQNIRQFEENAMLYAEVQPRKTYKISSINAGVHLAAAGFGVAFTMESYLQYMPRKDGFSCFLVGDASLQIPFSAIMRRGEQERWEIAEWIRLTKAHIGRQKL